MRSFSWRRSLSQTYKMLILVRYNPFRLLDITIWPIVIFMSVALFAQSLNTAVGVIGIVVLGSAGWRFLYQFQIEPALSIMEENWDHSLEHLMISPIKTIEILAGCFLTALIKSIFVVLLFILSARVFFSYTLPITPQLIIALAVMMLCGVIMAIISYGVVILKGSQSYGYLFAVGDVLAAFSGVFYSVTIFPESVQAAVQILPTTHAFELLRSSLGFGGANIAWLVGTMIVWFVLATGFCIWAIKRARRTGRLVKMQ